MRSRPAARGSRPQDHPLDARRCRPERGGFSDPRVEARVALAGPAVSAALGAALVGAGQIGGLLAAPAAVLEWLGWTNVVLLGFNLLPALPLDGGRVLRAALCGLGQPFNATRAAARVPKRSRSD